MANQDQGLWEKLRRVFLGGEQSVSVTARRTLWAQEQGIAMRPKISRMPPKSIEREAEPGWQRWGWRRKGNTYSGYFRALGNRWLGQIVARPGGGFDTYIWNPPEWVLRGAHWRCFQPRGNGWFYVHQAQPESVDHAIRSVQLVIEGRE